MSFLLIVKTAAFTCLVLMLFEFDTVNIDDGFVQPIPTVPFISVVEFPDIVVPEYMVKENVKALEKNSTLIVYPNCGHSPLVDVPDQLTKDILMHSKSQPGLQIGAWDRGYGFKGGKVDDLLVYNRTLTDYEIKIIA